MAPRQSDLLFVYGSLLTRIGHPKGERLRAECTLMGPASAEGRLYRVSWYPGFVPVPGSARVQGEIYRLASEQTLQWLDEYEGLARGDDTVTSQDEYARVVIDVTLATGTSVTAWAYVYRLDTAGLVEVPDGVWWG